MPWRTTGRAIQQDWVTSTCILCIALAHLLKSIAMEHMLHDDSCHLASEADQGLFGFCVLPPPSSAGLALQLIRDLLLDPAAVSLHVCACPPLVHQQENLGLRTPATISVLVHCIIALLWHHCAGQSTSTFHPTRLHFGSNDT